MTPSPDGLIKLPKTFIRQAVRSALSEDMGRAGDITTDSIVPEDTKMVAEIVSRQPGCIAGLEFAVQAFRRLGKKEIKTKIICDDGAWVEPGQPVLRVKGPARGILTAERVALNFVGHLSGIATATRQIANAVGDYPVAITCTRKTTPGLRAFEKYAVRAGGGANHRFGLDDGILIKDNHIAVAGGIGPAIERAKQAAGHMVKIEVEVDTLEQLAEALEHGADAVLLDNMSIPTLKEAVKMIDGRAIAEASGGITLETAPKVASTGVDVISIGWLTHSSPCLDVGLDFIK